MGLEELRKAIEDQAEKAETVVLADGKAEASRIIEEAKQQAEELVVKARVEAEAAKKDEARKISSANLRARRIVAEAEEAVIERTLSGLLARLGKMHSTHKTEYAKAFGLLAKQALTEMPGAKIRCAKRDAALAKKFGKLGEPIETAGGLLAESTDGRIRIDNTFESLIEERRDALKQEAHELLFGGK